jgi:type IV pilus assembly protein PilF
MLAVGVGCSLQDPEKENASRSADRSRFDQAEDAPAPRIHAMTHVAAGQMLERQGDLETAIEQYEKAIATNPRLVEAYNRLGIVYQKLGKPAEADQMFRHGLRVNPRSAMLRNNLGYSYLSQNRLEEAEQQFRQALNCSRDFKRARMNLAVTLTRAGRVDEGLVEFSNVVSSDVAHYNVGVIRLDQGDYTTAEASFRRALAINPDCSEARDHLQHVTRLVRTRPEGPPSPTAQSKLAGKDDEESLDPAP